MIRLIHAYSMLLMRNSHFVDVVLRYSTDPDAAKREADEAFQKDNPAYSVTDICRVPSIPSYHHDMAYPIPNMGVVA